MTGLPSTVTFQSSDPGKATVDPTSGVVTGVAPGSVTIRASITVDTLTKTAQTTLLVPDAMVTATTSGASRFYAPASVTIPLNGVIAWAFPNFHNVTFDNPPAPVDNIPSSSNGVIVTRTLTTAGTYNFHCTIHAGMTGTVTVH
jgi:plastocyanin